MPWRGSQPLPFTEGVVGFNASPYSGVYGLLRNNVWIYFGESGCIRGRLLDHLRREGNPCLIRNAPTQFAFELVPGEDTRKARRDELIREFWHLGLCNQRLEKIL